MYIFIQIQWSVAEYEAKIRSLERLLFHVEWEQIRPSVLLAFVVWIFVALTSSWSLIEQQASSSSDSGLWPKMLSTCFIGWIKLLVELPPRGTVTARRPRCSYDDCIDADLELDKSKQFFVRLRLKSPQAKKTPITHNYKHRYCSPVCGDVKMILGRPTNSSSMSEFIELEYRIVELDLSRLSILEIWERRLTVIA